LVCARTQGAARISNSRYKAFLKGCWRLDIGD
jgi:hypothetical protein